MIQLAINNIPVFATVCTRNLHLCKIFAIKIQVIVKAKTAAMFPEDLAQALGIKMEHDL